MMRVHGGRSAGCVLSSGKISALAVVLRVVVVRIVVDASFVRLLHVKRPSKRNKHNTRLVNVRYAGHAVCVSHTIYIYSTLWTSAQQKGRANQHTPRGVLGGYRPSPSVCVMESAPSDAAQTRA